MKTLPGPSHWAQAAATVLVLAPVTPAWNCAATTRRALLQSTAALSSGCIAQPVQAGTLRRLVEKAATGDRERALLTAATPSPPEKCYDSQYNEIPCGGLVEKARGEEVAPESFRKGLGAPVANADMVTVDRATGELVSDTSGNRNAPLRTYIPSGGSAEAEAASTARSEVKKGKAPSSMDLNNMVGVEFTSFPGLYPTIGGKLVQRGPFETKKDAYAALDTDFEREQLRVYDKAIKIKPRNEDVYQYKNAGFYFPGKGGGSGYDKGGSAFRDAEIARLQEERKR